MSRLTPETFTAWWQVGLTAARDVAALSVGVWILLFRADATTPLLMIGFLLLTLSASGAAKAALALAGKATG